MWYRPPLPKQKWSYSLWIVKPVLLLFYHAKTCGLLIPLFTFLIWISGEGNGKLLQRSCLEQPMSSMKRQKDMTLKDEPPRMVVVQYAPGEEHKNHSRKNEETEPKQKWCPEMMSEGESKVWCCQEQYYIETWNVRSINQGMLDWSNKRWQEWTLTF